MLDETVVFKHAFTFLLQTSRFVRKDARCLFTRARAVSIHARRAPVHACLLKAKEDSRQRVLRNHAS